MVHSSLVCFEGLNMQLRQIIKYSIDGSHIVAIYIQGSNNSKTGSMSQVYTLQADIDPITANRTGAGKST